MCSRDQDFEENVSFLKMIIKQTESSFITSSRHSPIFLFKTLFTFCFLLDFFEAHSKQFIDCAAD